MDKRRVRRQAGGVQGEGNYDAARKYTERTKRFVRSGRVEAAAQAAASKDGQEAAELEQAEQVGKGRAARVRRVEGAARQRNRRDPVYAWSVRPSK